MNELNQVEEKIEIEARYIKPIRYAFKQYTTRMSEGREFDGEKLVVMIQKEFDFSKEEARSVIEYAESRYEPTLALRKQQLEETNLAIEEITKVIDTLEEERKENVETIAKTNDRKVIKRQRSLKKQMYKDRIKLDELKKVQKDLEEQIETKNLKIEMY